MFEKEIRFVKDYFEKNAPSAAEHRAPYPFRNRFEHTMRVYKWAQRINREEKGDKVVVALAAIFHDVGKAVDSEMPHAELSADICGEYLADRGFSRNKRERIVRAVRLHSSKSIKKSRLSLEDRILIDADLLDEVGALAVLLDGMATALDGNASYIRAYERHLKYYDQLKNQRKYLKTKTGKRLYDERLRFLKVFIRNLKFELGL